MYMTLREAAAPHLQDRNFNWHFLLLLELIVLGEHSYIQDEITITDFYF